MDANIKPIIDLKIVVETTIHGAYGLVIDDKDCSAEIFFSLATEGTKIEKAPVREIKKVVKPEDYYEIGRFSPTNKPIRIYQNTTLEQVVKDVQKNQYKIIIVSTDTFPYASTHIVNTRIKRKQTPLVWGWRSLLLSLAETKSTPVPAEHPNMILKFNDQMNKTKIESKNVASSISFPIYLDPKISINDCKQFILDDLTTFIQSKARDPNYRSIIGLVEFDSFLGQTHPDYESELKFIEAVLELSKDFTIIMEDPTNIYGMAPMGIKMRASKLAKKGIAPTPYNTAHPGSQNLLDKLIANSVRIKLFGLKQPE